MCPSPIRTFLSVLTTSSFLPTMHLFFSALRSSRLSYLSRVVPPEILLPAAEWFDSSVRSTFSKRLGNPSLSADMSTRISLPVRFGGFGLRPVVRVSPIAYACSLASAAFDIVQLHVPVPSSRSSSAASSSSSPSSSLSSLSPSPSPPSLSLVSPSSPSLPSCDRKEREVKVRSGLDVSSSGSSDSTVDLDVHVPVSLRSTPQSESLGRVLASLPSSSPLPKVLSAFWSKFGFVSPPSFL